MVSKNVNINIPNFIFHSSIQSNWILKDKIRCFIRLLIFFTFNLLIKDTAWGSEFAVGCGAGEQLGDHLLKGLTSAVVLRALERWLFTPPRLQSLPDLRLKPVTFGLQDRLSNH